jgi:hypothetical protein
VAAFSLRQLSCALVSGWLLVACGSGQRPAPQSPPAAKAPTSPNPYTGIAMFGRSVTAQWFSHWGVKTHGGYQHGRFRVLHRVFDPYEPDESAWPRQAKQVLKRYGRYLAAVQYKLCFVDFTDGTDLDDYEDLARAMYEVVVKRFGKRLIIGNALPAVKSASSQKIIALHRRYNAWLEAFAAKHPGVVVFDQYRVLSSPAGYLKASYAQAPNDSHLNGAGYEALNKAYFPFLARQFPALKSKPTPASKPAQSPARGQ